MVCFDEYRGKLVKEGLYNCLCHIHLPCLFCTDTVQELYEEWCDRNDRKPKY